jgi:hypothetical protein
MSQTLVQTSAELSFTGTSSTILLSGVVLAILHPRSSILPFLTHSQHTWPLKLTWQRFPA